MPFPGLVLWLRRRPLVRWAWTGFWFLGLLPGVRPLWHPGHSVTEAVLVTAGAVVFIVAALCCFAFVTYKRPLRQRVLPLAVAGALAFVYNGVLGSDWTPMFIYLVVVAAMVLPLRAALAVNVSIVLAGFLLELALREPLRDYGWVLVSAALSGLLCAYAAERGRIKERLQRGENAMAQLAVNEERVRFARDLHDLLGHSLSLLSLKAQLAGRLVHADPDACAKQIAEMEEISRQALAEVRDSVTGYRRPTIAVELARAHTTLTSAGIEPLIDPSATDRARDLSPGREAALAWALRETVTNVVRHAAGARSCRIRLERAGAGGFVLTVQDDSPEAPAEPAAAPGNGLTGLGERLALEGGRLEAAPTSSGFRVRAFVPATDEEPVPATSATGGSPCAAP
jgi:two-component system sensor histidine kinase DesK